ncbi:MAG: ornithine carbamoyltransferase [Candidatus Micrarchaeota archaeon]
MNLLTLKDWTAGQLSGTLDLAIELKKEPKKYSSSLSQKSLAMLFEKTSTRTRMSFEIAMTQLGGHALFIDWKSTQLAKAELRDEMRCIDRYADAIMARVYAHESLQIMAKYCQKPIINGLSELYHPCQAVADLMTLKEKLGKLEGRALAYIGDGNNVCNSLIIACHMAGMKISVATPPGYEPLEKPDVLTTYPAEAAKGADAVYTDTWISMGQEAEKEKRMKDFSGYQITPEILGGAFFMHCLPAYRGYEVSSSVMDSPQSIVFDEAENRLHAQKAILLKAMGVA